MNSIEDRPLQGARILIAEDDAILAFDLGIALQKAGAKILGPALTLSHTLSLAQTAPLSAAVLDVSLRDEEVFPAAEALKERGVGIVFYTGYAAVESLQRDWPNAQVLTKPAPARMLIQAVRQVWTGRADRGAAASS
jgi:ActR/RegA family two-component response regulator